MQATITYLLTEQAQRAQMAATGQPVARKQVITIDVSSEQAAMLQVNEDGTPYLDLSGNWPGPKLGDLYWRDMLHMASISDGKTSNAFAGFNAPAPDLSALIAAAATKIAADKQYDIDYPASVLAADQRLADWVSSREHSTDYDASIWRNAIEQGGLKPVDSRLYGKDYLAATAGPMLKQATLDYLTARAATVAATRKATEAEATRLKADKEAREAAKEKLKTEYLAAWIAEHGTESQKARSADNLLCREEGIIVMADAAFAGANGVRYSPDSRPRPDCTCEACDDMDCGIKYDVDDGVDCLSERQYEIYQALRNSMPDAKYVLRTRTAVHDCDHSPNCSKAERPTCLVKIAVGPFTLQREYAL